MRVFWQNGTTGEPYYDPLSRQTKGEVRARLCEKHQAQQIYLEIKSSLLQPPALSPGGAFVLNLNISGLIRSNWTYLYLLESSFVGAE